MFPHFTFSGTTYQALHRKLTLFCTCVTQIILLALSLSLIHIYVGYCGSKCQIANPFPFPSAGAMHV